MLTGNMTVSLKQMLRHPVVVELMSIKSIQLIIRQQINTEEILFICRVENNLKSLSAKYHYLFATFFHSLSQTGVFPMMCN